MTETTATQKALNLVRFAAVLGQVAATLDGSATFNLGPWSSDASVAIKRLYLNKKGVSLNFESVDDCLNFIIGIAAWPPVDGIALVKLERL